MKMTTIPKTTLHSYDNGNLNCPRWLCEISMRAFDQLVNEQLTLNVNPVHFRKGDRILVLERYCSGNKMRMHREAVANIENVSKLTRITVAM